MTIIDTSSNVAATDATVDALAHATASALQLAPAAKSDENATATASAPSPAADAATSSPSPITDATAAAHSAAPTSAAAAAVAASLAASPAINSETGELLNGGYKRGGAANDPETGYYDEVEIEDMEYDEATASYIYPCPCGDKFRITKEELLDGEDIARCPSCSLLIKVIYDPDDLEEDE